MAPGLDVPPGLGVEEQQAQKTRAKNPRRRAKKAVQMHTKDDPATDDVESKATQRQGEVLSSEGGGPSGRHVLPAEVDSAVLEPSTLNLLSMLRNGGSQPQNVELDFTVVDTVSSDVAPNSSNSRRRRKSRSKRHSQEGSSSIAAPSYYGDEASSSMTGASWAAFATETAQMGGWGSPTAAAAAGQNPAWEQLSQTQSPSGRQTQQPASPAADEWHRTPPSQKHLSRKPRNSSGQTGHRDSPHAKTGFAHYWPQWRLQEALKRGEVLRCEFRNNPGDRRQGFAGLEGLPADIQIQGLENQNRAITGDQVAVQLLPQQEWLSQKVRIARHVKNLTEGSAENPRLDALKEILGKYATAPEENTIDAALRGAETAAEAKEILTQTLIKRPDLRATGKIVAILEPSFRRNRIVGALQRESWGYTLVPVDPRMPWGRVGNNKLPEDIRALVEESQRSEGDEDWVLVSALLDEWPVWSRNPNVTVRESLGQAGEIEVETRAILENEGVDLEEFEEDVLECLPPTPWQISAEEIESRLDLRQNRIFTIDPPTARDLDDALSVDDLGSGRWRVGVHIADVSHFIPGGSALDAKAAKRATSVYLVQRVIPMLPALLCEELCSLNPGTDRLAFSVIWELDENGKVHHQWTGKTIIRSCTKLSYHHAQKMIEGQFSAADEANQALVLEQPHEWHQVTDDVLKLNRIARNLHRRRFENGALRLDNVKLAFGLDDDGNPAECSKQEQRQSNELVAEFMLLANMSVAQLIGRAFPEKALLRRHVPPEERKMGELEEAAEKLGYDVDCTSAAALHTSLQKLKSEGLDSDVVDVLQLMVTKPMKQAQYFSTGTYDQVGAWRHFALAVPMYTHFTSPIRRYPDVVVHRLLASLLASDPLAATRIFDPAPIGSLERDAEDRTKEDQAADAASALRKLTLDGDLQAVSEEEPELLLPGEAQFLNTDNTDMGDEASLSSMSSTEAEATTGSAAREKGPPSIVDLVEPSTSRTTAHPGEAEQDAEKVPEAAIQTGAVERTKKPAPKLLAETVGDGRRNPEKPRRDGLLPVSEELLENADLEVIAAHCNTRKTSAKSCSDLSSKLYLCLMLRKQPMILEAITKDVNGSKFFDLYVPALGIEARIQVSEIVPPVVAEWDAESRVLTLLENVSAVAPGTENGTSEACLGTVRNAENLLNPEGLVALPLPLKIKPLERTPVVVSARSPGIAKPLAAFALLYITAGGSAAGS